jgi:hypothetical protein
LECPVVSPADAIMAQDRIVVRTVVVHSMEEGSVWARRQRAC